MSVGNPMVRFRLPKKPFGQLERHARQNGREPGAEAKERVLRSLDAEQGAGNRPAPVKPPPAEPDAGRDLCPCYEVPPGPCERHPKTVENALKRATRLKREWKELERDQPALAREIGSFEEFERRQT